MKLTNQTHRMRHMAIGLMVLLLCGMSVDGYAREFEAEKISLPSEVARKLCPASGGIR